MKFITNSNFHEVDFFRTTWNKIRILGLGRKHLTYRLKWNILERQSFNTSVPVHVDLELSSVCDLRCKMCPHGRDTFEGLDKHIMKYEVARKVIDECAEIGVASMKFSGRGEVTLHPNIAELAEYAKSRGIVDLHINTHGNRLTPEKIKRFVDCGVDRLIISVDGATKDTYESIRIKGNYDKLVKNLEALIAYRNSSGKKKPLIRLQFVKMKENIHEFEDFRKQWANKVDVVVGLDYSNRSDVTDRSVVQKVPVGRAYCPEPFRRLMVSSSGEVQMCCVDWSRKYIVGDAKTEKIQKIWKGEKIESARTAIKNLDHHKIASCKDCFHQASYKYKKVRVPAKSLLAGS